jgi:hypothetical protein
MSYKDSYAKHTKDYCNHFNHFDGPIGRSWFHAGFFRAGKWIRSHSRLKFGNSQAAGAGLRSRVWLLAFRPWWPKLKFALAQTALALARISRAARHVADRKLSACHTGNGQS